FDGVVSLWASSETADPALTLDAADAGPSRSDDDSGGGTTAFLATPVRAGDELTVELLARRAAARSSVDLHVVSAVESEEARTLAARIAGRVEAGHGHWNDGDAQLARDELAACEEALDTAPDSTSPALADALWQSALLARTLEDFHAAGRLLERAL